MSNQVNYYLGKIEKQLDFHRGLHLFEMEMNSDFTTKVVFLKEKQQEYITNLFGGNQTIQENYEKEFKNDIIVESTFNPKDEINRFFSFLKENYIGEVKKSNLLSEAGETKNVFSNLSSNIKTIADKALKQSIADYWKRLDDPIGYWKVLFEVLKKAGLSPKYGLDGKETKDAAKATFIYAGSWVIWKDKTKNNGYPITRKLNGTTYSAKFTSNGNKYAGEDFSKTTVGVYNPTTKSLASLTLKYFLTGADIDVMKSVDKNAQENKIKKETNSVAQNVVSKLKSAFDRDSDGVYDDYDGTDEDGALSAINLITNKNILDKVNALIKSSASPYDSLKDWVNDEMSDIDRDQYKAIWDRLESLGYKGYIQNDFLAATGKGDIVGMVKAGWNWLKEKGIPWFMEKLRDALGSTVGAVLQQLLDYTGIGAVAVSVFWGVLTIFDVSQIASGVGSWAKLFFSVLGLLTAGALAKTVGSFLKPFFNSTGGTISSFFAKIAEQPWFVKYIKPIVSWIGSKLSWAMGLLESAGTWLVETLGATTIGKYVTKAGTWLKSIAESIVQWAGAGAKAETQALAKAEVQKAGEKLITKAVTDPLKDKAKEGTANVAGYVGGKKAETAVKLAYDVSDLSKKPTELGKDFSSGNVGKVVKTGTKVYGGVSNVVDKSKEIAGVKTDDKTIKDVTNKAVKGAENAAKDLASTTTSATQGTAL